MVSQIEHSKPCQCLAGTNSHAVVWFSTDMTHHRSGKISTAFLLKPTVTRRHLSCAWKWGEKSTLTKEQLVWNRIVLMRGQSLSKKELKTKRHRKTKNPISFKSHHQISYSLSLSLSLLYVGLCCTETQWRRKRWD